MKANINFKVGTSVIVKPGVKDPDLGIDIGGWQGRISEIQDDLVCIDWDSVTLKNMPGSAIAECEQRGMGWSQMYLEATDVELTKPRDTEEDVARVIDRLEAEHAWDFLGEEGGRIQAVVTGIDPDDEWAALKAWRTHLRKVLRFPFEAEVSEFQERGPLQAGDRVTVLRIADLDDLYGVLVEVKHRRGLYLFPLCDLEAVDRRSPHHDFVQDYAVWFANR